MAVREPGNKHDHYAIAYMVTPHLAILYKNSDMSTLWGVSNHALQF